MHYPIVSNIYQEITKLVADYEKVGDNDSTDGMLQWPFLKNNRFSCKDGLARFRLLETNYSKTLKTLSSLS